MLALVALLVFSTSPLPRGKPLTPALFAQHLLDTTLGPELLDAASPTLELEDAEGQWLAVEVWATTGGMAGTPVRENVELTVKQGKRTQTLKGKQRTEADTEFTPFFVPIVDCSAMELSARVGKRKSPTVTLALKCR